MVQVVRVIDGDTIEVVFNDGVVETVRLLGIDTPETFSSNNPNGYGEMTDIACLDEWGTQATLEVTDTLYGEVVILSPDPVADVRGSFGRLLAYVEFEGQDLNAALVEKGLARVYTEGRERAAVRLNIWLCRKWLEGKLSACGNASMESLVHQGEQSKGKLAVQPRAEVQDSGPVRGWGLFISWIIHPEQ